MVSTPVERLMTAPVTLIIRADSGDEDEWGSPVMVEERRETTCYYRLRRTVDTDEGGTVLAEHWELFLPADTPLDAYDAVELNGDQYEVIGKPDPEWNARIGEVNHVKLAMSRARP